MTARSAWPTRCWVSPRRWAGRSSRSGSRSARPGATLSRRYGFARWPRPAPAATGSQPPWPDLLIGCGRNAVAPALAVKRASGGRTFWVQIQDPRFARSRADLLVVPSHDPATGANVVTTLGAVHRVTPARLAVDAARLAPLFASLPSTARRGADRRRQPRLSLDAGAARGARRSARVAGQARAWVSPSRRRAAPAPAWKRCCGRGFEGLPAFIWDGSGDNPYFAMLGLADAIIVTADSVNMVSEAAATGKPVHVVPLEGGSAKFARFHRAMEEAGITRPFQRRDRALGLPPARRGGARRRGDPRPAGAPARRGRLMARRAALFLASFLVLCGALVVFPGDRSLGERALLRARPRLLPRRLAAHPPLARGHALSSSPPSSSPDWRS